MCRAALVAPALMLKERQDKKKDRDRKLHFYSLSILCFSLLNTVAKLHHN